MYPKELPKWYKPIYTEDEVFSDFPERNVSVCYYEKEKYIGMHSQDYYELIIVISGTGCHYVGEMAIPISAGDTFVITPGVEHGYFCAEGEELTMCYILFRSSFMKRFYADMLSVPGATKFFELEPYLRGAYESSLFLHLDSRAFSEIKKQLDELVIQNSEEYTAFYEFSVLYTVGTLCRLLKKQSDSERFDDRADREILELLDYLGEHFDEKIDIENICRMTNMSRATLHRRFKAVTKLSPMEYITRLKINEAKKMMENTELSKTEIAQKCGFYDLSHMGRELKK